MDSNIEMLGGSKQMTVTIQTFLTNNEQGCRILLIGTFYHPLDALMLISTT